MRSQMPAKETSREPLNKSGGEQLVVGLCVVKALRARNSRFLRRFATPDACTPAARCRVTTCSEITWFQYLIGENSARQLRRS
jgi:hypothetical protein